MTPRESIILDATRKASLEREAKRVGACNTRGPKTGKPSWRALLYAIADGRVRVERNDQGQPLATGSAATNHHQPE